MERGLIDADLGGHVMKKRVAVGGRGKSGGGRTLLAYKSGDKAFFVYWFARNERVNDSMDELKALKLLAKELMNYSDRHWQATSGMSVTQEAGLIYICCPVE